MRITTLVFATLFCLASVSGASAQGYFSLNGALVIETDSDVTDSDTLGNSISGDIEFDNGFGFNGAVGYAWNDFRLEGEVSYRQNDLDQLSVSSVTLAGIGTFTVVGSAPVNGDVTQLAFMVNGWYDINTGSKWVPSLGAGIGFATVAVDSSDLLFDEDDTVLAYQFGAQLGYKVNPAVMVVVGYRFFATQDLEFKTGSITTDAENQSHNIEIGYRVKF